MSKSILQKKDGRCYICQWKFGNYAVYRTLHKHHVFGGPRRKISEKEGLTVYLCPAHHNMSKYSVHADKSLMDEMHRIGQREWEKCGSRAEWMKLMGKNYLEES